MLKIKILLIISITLGAACWLLVEAKTFPPWLELGRRLATIISPSPTEKPLSLDVQAADSKALASQGPTAGRQEHEPEALYTKEELEALRLIRAHFAAGDYATCLQLIEAKLEEGDYSEAFLAWLEKQRQVALISSGWLHLRTGGCEQAIEELGSAAEKKKSLEISQGLVYCYHHLHRWEEAEAECEAYLRQDKQDLHMLHLCADTQESQQNYQEAIALLEQAVAISQGEEHTAFSAKLQAMRHKARENHFQQQQTSSHFNLLFRGEEAPPQWGLWVLERLESSLESFIRLWHMKELQGVVDVILYPQESFGQLVPQSPHWVGGAFDGRIRLPIRYHQKGSSDMMWGQLEETLKHELTHAVLSEMAGRRALPPWLDEGLAQRFACHLETCRVLKSLPVRGDFLPPEDFLKAFSQYKQVAKVQRLYAQSLYMILTLEALQGQEALVKLVEAVQAQGPLSSDALLQPLGLSFRQLHARASEFWQQRLELAASSP